MPWYRVSLQTLGAILLLALAFACKGKSGGSSPASTTTATITGTITYARVPLAKNASGLPTGLVDASVSANLQSLPARGVTVRAFQQVDQTQPDGSTTKVWVLTGTSVTSAAADATAGQYSLTLPKDRTTMVEVLSTFNGGVNLLAEPAGIGSPTMAPDRTRYALRKAPDGTAPVNITTPSSVLSTDAVLNFSVNLNDVWWVVNPSVNSSNGVAPLLSQAALETSYSGRTAGLGSGSRILGIGDTIASFLAVYGSANPGSTLDLHYWAGRPEPSYVEYNQGYLENPPVFPQAYDASAGNFHYFGVISANPSNDDAWDEGVILPLLARNVLFAGNINRTFSVPRNPILPVGSALPDLSPDVARMEGLADAMAANVLKSPYLADTQATSLLSLKDVRDTTDHATTPPTPYPLNPYSAPAIRAFAWEVILKANSLSSPGTAATWSTLNPLAAMRFFLPPGLTNGATDTTARDIEPLNIFSQITRLKETRSAADPVDLASVFTDAALTPLAAPFGLTWPRPTSGTYASFVADWGTDPTGALPAVALSMSKASLVNGQYPNASQGQVFYAGFNLNADKRCVLVATISPALPAGARIDVDLPRMSRTFSFTGTGSTTETIVIPVFTTAPVYHSVRVRLLSPSALQPDVTLRLNLTPSL